MSIKLENPIKLEEDKRYSLLSDDKKKKIDDLNNMSTNEYQLKVIKKSKPILRDGDVFVLSPYKGVYFYGKILKANINNVNRDNFIHGKQLVFIFKCKTTEKDMARFYADYDKLLIRPSIVDISYWNKGYFYNVGNEEITYEEKNLDYGLVHVSINGIKFYKEDGVIIDTPKIMGWYGISTINGIAAKVHRELIIDPTLVN